MITAFLIGFALPVVPFLLGLGLLALHKSRQGYSMREARHRLKVR